MAIENGLNIVIDYILEFGIINEEFKSSML